MINNLIRAQIDACGENGLFPCPTATGEETISTTEAVIIFVLSLVFIGFLAFGIYILIKAAFNILRSNGDPERIQSGTQATKGVFIGLGMLLIGLIGFIIVAFVLKADGIFDVPAPEPPPGLDGVFRDT